MTIVRDTRSPRVARSVMPLMMIGRFDANAALSSLV
jgi:hypothetical protein